MTKIIDIPTTIAPAKDDKETWQMTYANKKLVYGSANRVAVGGKPEEVVGDHQKGAIANVSITQNTIAQNVLAEVSDARILTWSPWRIMRFQPKLSLD